ncbi:hypothetical protein LTR50_005534 [Elasticomyces elasticus]|nr:hypothetical protein LTR50_005534 [Elasticomyces elasticus]
MPQLLPKHLQKPAGVGRADHRGREGKESRYSSYTAALPPRDRRYQEDVRVYEEDRQRRPDRREEHIHIHEQDRYTRDPRDTTETRVEIDRERYQEPYQRYSDAQIDVRDRSYDREYRTTHGPATTYAESNIDVAERDFRQRTTPFAEDYASARWQDKSTRPREFVRQDYSRSYPQATQDFNTATAPRQEDNVPITETRTTVEQSEKHKLDMGYYDEDGHYHSFRHGLHRAADRILHPIHGGQHHRHDRDEDIVVEDRDVSISAPRVTRESITVRNMDRRGPPNTITIPCHHIRIGDLLILQGRPCQVIRITTSAQTGQHRYLGVDLFSKQLHEESSFVSNPSPSVIVQNMLGPVFKQYRVLDIRDDGRVVAMTETGDVKQGLPVLDQSSLLARLSDSFNNGRGSVRVLVISDEGRELAVDYKVVHGSRL